MGAETRGPRTGNEAIEREWGELADVGHYVPSKARDETFARRLATYFRRSASPGAAVALLRMNTQLDIRHILPTIRVPTLVINRTGDRDANVEEGRWIARQIPSAHFVELSGEDHLPWVGDQDAVVDEIQEFLTGARSIPEPIVFWRRCFLPTSLIPPSMRPVSAIVHGAIF